MRSHFHLSKPQVRTHLLLRCLRCPKLFGSRKFADSANLGLQKILCLSWDLWALFHLSQAPSQQELAHLLPRSLICPKHLGFQIRADSAILGFQMSSVSGWIFWLFSSGLRVDLLFWFGIGKESKKPFQKCWFTVIQNGSCSRSSQVQRRPKATQEIPLPPFTAPSLQVLPHLHLRCPKYFGTPKSADSAILG